MGEVIGTLLPQAVGVAVSPVPVIAVILMLLAPRARGTSLGFLAGWVIGITAVTVLVVVLSRGADVGDEEGPSTAAGWVKLVLGLLLLALAAGQWRKRPRRGEEAALPAWMNAIDTMTPVRGLGLGVLLSAVNPKNLALCAAAGVAIADAGLGSGDTAVAVAVFVAVAASTVAVPVLAYTVAAGRIRGPLDELRDWLQQNNATVMAVLLLVLGVVIVGQALGVLL